MLTSFYEFYRKLLSLISKLKLKQTQHNTLIFNYCLSYYGPVISNLFLFFNFTQQHSKHGIIYLKGRTFRHFILTVFDVGCPITF